MGAHVNKFGLLLVVAGCVISVPAAAGWDYAEWGMRPEQVVAASAGAARLATKDELKREQDEFDSERKKFPAYTPPKMHASTRAMALALFEGIGFEVNFDFLVADGTLSSIRMLNHACSGGERVETLLRALYGTPSRTVIQSRRPIRLEWKDAAHNTKVVWEHLTFSPPPSCYIEFRPLAQKP